MCEKCEQDAMFCEIQSSFKNNKSDADKLKFENLNREASKSDLKNLENEAEKRRKDCINGSYKDIYDCVHSLELNIFEMKRFLDPIAEAIRLSGEHPGKLHEALTLLDSFKDRAIIAEQNLLVILGVRKIASDERANSQLERLSKEVLNHG